MPRTSEPGRSVASRLLSVLFAFSSGSRILSLAEITERTGLPRATTARMVAELIAARALEKQLDGRYAVGVRLWQLGTLAPHTESLRESAQPVLEDLYTALHQHVQLAVLKGEEAVVVERLSAQGAVPLTSRVGGRLPLHASAVGKVLLAHADRGLQERILSRDLPRFTAGTITDAAALDAALTATRMSGVATVREELTEGADSVATRIVDARGEVVAALSVVVRAGTVNLPVARPSTVASGLRLSRRLGWRPGTAPIATGENAVR